MVEMRHLLRIGNMSRSRLALTVALPLALLSSIGHAQSVGSTTVLAPFAGHMFTPASGQSSIGFWGTDLGFSVYDGTNLRFYFGDSWADSAGSSIDPINGDDTLGIVSGANFANGDAVDAYIASHPPGAGKLSWQAAAPPVKFQLNAFGAVAMSPLYRGGINGTFLPSGLGKTPLAAFANRLSGSARGVFAIYERVRPTECSGGSNPTCSNGFTCDRGIGSYLGFTGENDFPCVIATPNQPLACLAVPGGGMCQDRTSSVYSSSDDGRILGIALTHEVGNADHQFSPELAEVQYTRSWQTNKFVNPATATVKDFLETRANGAGNVYTVADGQGTLANQKVFLWGRPNFVAYGATCNSAKLYFAYADMPSYSATGNFTWTVHYFKNLNASGVPQFSTAPIDAAALNLNAPGGGPTGCVNDNTREVYDIVNQMTVAWVPALSKWVMFYGGDQDDDGLELFVGSNYGLITHDPDRALHVRYASQPWGPWSAPQQLLKAGNPATSPPVAGTQYAPGGILHHPGCSGSNCAPTESAFDATSHGHLYAPNIVDKWTTTRNTTSADVYWTVSSWNPMQTVLMRTRLSP
jgi:hypothetical protein